MRRTNSERSMLLGGSGGGGARSGPPSGGGGGASLGGGGGVLPPPGSSLGGGGPAAPPPGLPPSGGGGGAFYHHQHSLSGGGLPMHHGHASAVGLGGYRRTGSGGLPRPGSNGGLAGALLSALQQPQQTALALLSSATGADGGKGPLLPSPPSSSPSSSSASALAPLVGWIRALLLLAVVGFVLLDVALFEAVVARTSSPARTNGLAGAGATAAATAGAGAGVVPTAGGALSGGSGIMSAAGLPPPPPFGGGANSVMQEGGTAAADGGGEEEALIELPKVLPSRTPAAAAAARAARLAAAEADAAVERGALQDAPAAARAAVAADEAAEAAAAAAITAAAGGKGRQKRGGATATTPAQPAVTLLLQRGVLPPMPAPAPLPPTATAASALLAALPPAFRLPVPAPAPASVRALATTTVGAAPLIGLRAGAAAAANPARAPRAGQGAGGGSGVVTTEAARAAAVSLFGADVFAAEDRAAAAGAGEDDDEEDETTGGGRRKKASKRPAARRRRLPPGFDWRAYLEYNPDVRAFGVNTPATAAGHYLAYGAQEGRLSRRVPVALRYTACGGLANQHYSHVSALALAVALGADALLPDAARRDTFAHYFSEDPNKNKVHWRGAPLASLWDLSSAAELLRAAGGDAALSPLHTSPPDLSRPAEAFQTYGLGPPGTIGVAQVVRLEGVYQKALPLRELVEEARESVVRAAMAAVSGARQAAVARGESDALFDPRYDVPPPVVLDLPCALFSVEAAESPLAAAVARQLRFSPAISALADRVVAAMAAGLGGSAEEAMASSSALAAARRDTASAASLGGGRNGGGRNGGGGGGDKNTAPRTAAQRLSADARFWRSGAGGFNGLHLRVEADARDWLRAMGGREAFWGAYLDLLREAGFGTDEQARRAMAAPPASPGAAAAAASAAASLAAEAAASSLGAARNGTSGALDAPPLSRPGLPLYVATGLPSYAKPGSKAARALEELRARLLPYGARLVLKEDVLPAAELSALQPDQLALVDFLVLVRSRAFVGVSASTFSVLVREYRALHALSPRSSSWLVDCEAVGSEPLFARAAVFEVGGDALPVLGSHATGGAGGGGRGAHDLL